jgi:hypothetical protein
MFGIVAPVQAAGQSGSTKRSDEERSLFSQDFLHPELQMVRVHNIVKSNPEARLTQSFDAVTFLLRTNVVFESQASHAILQGDESRVFSFKVDTNSLALHHCSI